MKQFPTSILIFLNFALFAQQLTVSERGTVPLKINSNSTGTTRALVVGISDYEDKDIPDLKYANRDAEIFND